MTQAHTGSSPAPAPLAASAVPAAASVRRRHPWLAPLVPVSPRTRWLLGLSFFVLFFAIWALATLGGFVPRTFLADPWRWRTRAGCCSRNTASWATSA